MTALGTPFWIFHFGRNEVGSNQLLIMTNVKRNVSGKMNERENVLLEEANEESLFEELITWYRFE